MEGCDWSELCRSGGRRTAAHQRYIQTSLELDGIASKNENAVRCGENPRAYKMWGGDGGTLLFYHVCPYIFSIIEAACTPFNLLDPLDIRSAAFSLYEWSWHRHCPGCWWESGAAMLWAALLWRLWRFLAWPLYMVGSLFGCRVRLCCLVSAAAVCSAGRLERRFGALKV